MNIGERTGYPNEPGNGARARGPVATNVVLRPVANPLPLGLFAIGAGAFIIAIQQLDWLPAGETAAVGWLLFAFAVPLALISALIAMFSRDTAAGTALGIGAATLAGFGLTYIGGTPLSADTAAGTVGGAVAATGGSVAATAATSNIFAWFLFASAAALAITAITSAMGRPVLAAAILTFGLWIIATAIFQLSDVDGWQTIAGIVGLVAAATALVAATLREAAEEMIHTTQSASMPSMLRDARYGDDFVSSVPGLEQEPGVRARL
jgi:hypothetical protein